MINSYSVEEIAGPVPEIHLAYDQILKGGGKFWDDVNGGYLPENLVLGARREEVDWVDSEGFYEIVTMQECKRRRHETVRPDLSGHRQVCGSRHAREFDRICVRENSKRRSKVRFKELYPLVSCSLQCHLLKL